MGHCGVGARAIPCVPSCVVVLCDVTKTYSGTLLAHWCAAGKTDVEKRVNRMSDLSRKLVCFRACGCGTVFRAHFGAEHCLPFSCE